MRPDDAALVAAVDKETDLFAVHPGAAPIGMISGRFWDLDPEPDEPKRKAVPASSVEP